MTGLVTVTSNGISTIPAFTLGKPAAFAALSVARGALSLEPELRIGLDGKPWNYMVWGRYRVVDRERLRVGIGAQHAVIFGTTAISAAGDPGELIVARRYLAAEVSPSYSPTKSVSVGPYYLYSHGLEEGVAKHTHMLALRANLSTAGAPSATIVQINPQVYYLKAGVRDGTYFNAGLSLSRRGLPLSVSGTLNTALRTRIAGQSSLWNVNVHYAIR